jgi:hypothetical protein
MSLKYKSPIMSSYNRLTIVLRRIEIVENLKLRLRICSICEVPTLKKGECWTNYEEA